MCAAFWKSGMVVQVVLQNGQTGMSVLGFGVVMGGGECDFASVSAASPVGVSGAVKGV